MLVKVDCNPVVRTDVFPRRHFWLRSNRRWYLDWKQNLALSCCLFKPYGSLKTVQALYELLPVINSFLFAAVCGGKVDTQSFRNSLSSALHHVTNWQTLLRNQTFAQLQGLWETLFMDSFSCKRPHLYPSCHLIRANSFNTTSDLLKTSTRQTRMSFLHPENFQGSSFLHGFLDQVRKAVFRLSIFAAGITITG